MRKILIILCLLIANEVYAQSCIPKPDCADMGYTETSCDGAYIKCPFDTSKMACLTERYELATPLNCAVGMIYYADGSCSLTYDNSKVVTGIVVKDNALVMSKPIVMTWSSAYIDTSLTNMSSSQAIADMNGKSNTAVIVSAYSGESTSKNAAIYCNSYTGGIPGTAGRWYLPAAGELYTYIHGNYATLNSLVSTIGWSNFSSTFWSSSEYSSTSAWYVNSDGGNMSSSSKNNRNYSVSCLLALS